MAKVVNVSPQLCYLTQIAYLILLHSVQANAGKAYCDCLLPDLLLHQVFHYVTHDAHHSQTHS